MSSRNIRNKKSYPFDVVWSRIQDSTPIKTQKQLADTVQTSQSNISKRSSENIFPIEWAFVIAQIYNLNTDWIMTGVVSIKSSESEPDYNSEVLCEIDKWLTELVAKEPSRKEWFLCNFLDAFPIFAKWKKSLEQEERKDTSFQNKAA